MIGLARLIRVRQPRLWDWYLALRRKQRVFELLDPVDMTPLVHVSSRYPASRHCVAVVAPLAAHPSRPGEVIVCDLADDPAAWLALDEDDIADRIFTARADLPEGVERIPLRTVRANRSPALAPLSVLKGIDHGRLQIDLERSLAHLDTLRAAAGLAEKAAPGVFPGQRPAATGGSRAGAVRRLPARRGQAPAGAGARHAAGATGSTAFAFRDPRYAELLFRYRARNWPHTLGAGEHARWEAFRRDRLTRPTPLTGLTLAQYFDTIAALRRQEAPRTALLDQLQAWGHELQGSIVHEAAALL